MTHSAPAEPAPRGSLPDALTFFLTHDQRRAVLKRLNTTAAQRTAALLEILSVSVQTQSTQRDAEARRETKRSADRTRESKREGIHSDNLSPTPSSRPSRSSR